MGEARCKTCRYVDSTQSPSGIVGERITVCRALPPAAVATTTREGLLQLTCWPSVVPATDWCGKHHPKQVGE